MNPSHEQCLQPPPLTAVNDALRLEKDRSPARDSLASTSLSNLPYHTWKPSLSALFASTSSLQDVRNTPAAGPPTAARSKPSNSRSNTVQSRYLASSGSEDMRNLVVRAFAPRIAVLASSAVDDLLRQKGTYGGLLELLRPYGETILGKVTIRDSSGASRSYEDYGVRFTGLRDGLEAPWLPERQNQNSAKNESQGSTFNTRVRTGGEISQIEDVVERHLSFAESHSDITVTDYLYPAMKATDQQDCSAFYSLYLRRVLSGMPTTPHETFSHPVACVIAISSRSQVPIEELRHMTSSTVTGDQRLPHWIDNEYLRYYVLIHDEDHDDVAKSTALFEQMKRHFGLHCHLLRLRSTRAVPSDDDTVRLPACTWLSAAEELAEIHRREDEDDPENVEPCLFESDVTALRSFVREVVVQSVVPTMERLSATWNDQIASKRRGLTGRFASISRKWSPFGLSSRNTSGLAGAASSSPNYDSLQGFYRPDTPEALMRKLADYAFMLRDYRLAQGTYDLLKADFNQDKAWKYYAGANEMAAISTLLSSEGTISKARTDSIDQLLETAWYTYTTRCNSSYHALRTLAIAVELLQIRSTPAADDAAKWAAQVLDSRLVGPIGHALFTERIVACSLAKNPIGSLDWGGRKRKAAFWSALATDAWMGLGKLMQAERCLGQALVYYGLVDENKSKMLKFSGIKVFLDELRQSVNAAKISSDVGSSEHEKLDIDGNPNVDQETEQLDMQAQVDLDSRGEEEEPGLSSKIPLAIPVGPSGTDESSSRDPYAEVSSQRTSIGPDLRKYTARDDGFE